MKAKMTCPIVAGLVMVIGLAGAGPAAAAASSVAPTRASSPELVAHQTAPHETIPHETVPHETAPHQTAPHQTAPHQTAPHETTPHETVPHDTTPHQRAPHVVRPQRSRALQVLGVFTATFDAPPPKAGTGNLNVGTRATSVRVAPTHPDQLSTPIVVLAVVLVLVGFLVYPFRRARRRHRSSPFIGPPMEFTSMTGRRDVRGAIGARIINTKSSTASRGELSTQKGA